MTTLDERYKKGQAIRRLMAAGDPTHFTLPGIDQLAPDLKRIIDEALYGAIWTRPALDARHRCICTLAALMVLQQWPLLRRHIVRCLNLGLTPDQVVEAFIQLTFYVGVPAVESALRITKEIFDERAIQFTPTRVYDPQKTIDDLYEAGVRSHQEHMGEFSSVYPEDPDSEEMDLYRLIHEYHWGAIYTRPHLDSKSRAICSLAALSVLGYHDRSLRRRIAGALNLGVTPSEIMEVFLQVMLYGGFYTSRGAMVIARSVFIEQGLIKR